MTTVGELRRRRSLVVDSPHGPVALFWNDGDPVALADVCVHRQRQLSRGTIFNGRVVCPGHQWAFDIRTGHCPERGRTQPIYRVRVTGEAVEVDLPGLEVGVDRRGHGRAP